MRLPGRRLRLAYERLAFVSAAVRATSIGPDGTCACVVSTSVSSRHVTEENVGPVVQGGGSVVVVVVEGVVVVVTTPG